MRFLIHATSVDGDKLVRDTKTSRWKVRAPSGAERHVSLVEAGRMAAEWAAAGGAVQTGLPGSGRFDGHFEKASRALRDGVSTAA